MRERLGSSAVLAVILMAVDGADRVVARAAAREQLAFYLHLPNYANHLRRLGFDDGDLAPHASDRLVDAIVAWGDERAIARRVREHLDAGADHVSINVAPYPEADLIMDRWRRLAPALMDAAGASLRRSRNG